MGTAWAIVGIVIPLLLGLGAAFATGSVMSAPEFLFARGCFAVSALLLAGMASFWLYGSTVPTLARVSVGALAGLALFVALPEALRWVNYRQKLVENSLPPTGKKELSDTEARKVEVLPIVHSDVATPITHHATPNPVVPLSVQSGRIIIQQIQYLPDPADPLHRQVQVILKNQGPGPAYVGYSGFAFLVGKDASEARIDEKIKELTGRALSAPLNRDNAIESGSETSGFTVRGAMPESLWQDVVNGKATICAIAVYGYLDDATAARHVNIAQKAVRYSGGDGSGMDMDTVRQSTKSLSKPNGK